MWYDRPEAGWISRPVIRETRRPSSICSSTACCSFCFLSVSMSSNLSACATVRGKPSSMKLHFSCEPDAAISLSNFSLDKYAPLPAIFVVFEFAFYHVHHDLITDKSALIHYLLSFPTQRSLLCNLRSEHIAGCLRYASANPCFSCHLRMYGAMLTKWQAQNFSCIFGA